MLTQLLQDEKYRDAFTKMKIARDAVIFKFNRCKGFTGTKVQKYLLTSAKSTNTDW